MTTQAEAAALAELHARASDATRAALAWHDAVLKMAAAVEADVPVPNDPPINPPPDPGPTPAPTYALAAARDPVGEGETVVFRLSTTGVAEGTVLAYSIDGASDVAGPSTGTLTLLAVPEMPGACYADLAITLLADEMTEGTERIGLLVGEGLASAYVTVLDTSTTPPAPPPPAPPPSPAPGIQSMPFDPSHRVEPEGWEELGGRYFRGQFQVTLSGPAARVRMFGTNGTLIPIAVPMLGLEIDGVLVTEKVPGGASVVDFTVDATRLSPGVHRVQAVAPGWTCVPYWVYIAGAAPAYTPVVSGSYWMAMHLGAPLKWVEAPYAYKPTSVPRAPRAAPAFATALPRREMHCEQVVPLRWGDTHRVCRTAAGVDTSFAVQPYHWSDMTAMLPRVPLLDGPRGIGTVCMATHLHFSKSMPGALYFCDPWRLGKVTQAGEIITLAGYRHRGIASHWQSAPDLELVGDWSAVPAARRGFRELWGMAILEPSLALAEDQPPIPNDGAGGAVMHHHTSGPVFFLADTQMNRICRLEFDSRSHLVPPKITEFITGLRDPWDVVCVDGLLYVTERLSHRIAAYDAFTGTYLRTVIEGAALAAVDSNREVVRLAPIATLQAQPCVAPEGLYYLDGWLWWGSKAQGQVRKVRPDGTGMLVVCGVPMDDNTKFMKIAIGGGGFGGLPGTVLTCTWSNTQQGMPCARKPDGSLWTWYEIPGAGAEVGAGHWGQFVYPTAVAVSDHVPGYEGAVAVGGANEGLLVVTRKTATEGPPSAAAIRGGNDYMARGLNLLYGSNGFGFYGLPLPWGVTTDIDAFLAHVGHTRG